MQPSQPLRVHHSLIAAEALIDILTSAYELEPPIACRLVSSNSNDHYLVADAATDDPWPTLAVTNTPGATSIVGFRPD